VRVDLAMVTAFYPRGPDTHWGKRKLKRDQ
jgi:hypothetical protein